MSSARLATLAQIVSQAAMEIGITQRPVSQVIGSADQDIVQMGALLVSVAMEVIEEEPYNTILGDGMWVMDGQTHLFKDVPTSDTDLVAFDRRLAINGIKWRFLKGKSLEFGEEQRDFTVRMNKLAARANARVLDLDEEEGRSA
jgi:hypothetical protein